LVYAVHKAVLFVYLLAPSAPAEVFMTSNATDAITIQWTNPLIVLHRVDRYYVKYQAVNEPHGYEMILEDIPNSYDSYGYYEVNSFYNHIF